MLQRAFNIYRLGTRETHFSARHKEILRFMALGYDNIMIAQQLSISSTTLRNHINQIKNKTCLMTREDVVRYAQEHQLQQEASA